MFIYNCKNAKYIFSVFSLVLSHFATQRCVYENLLRTWINNLEKWEYVNMLMIDHNYISSLLCYIWTVRTQKFYMNRCKIYDDCTCLSYLGLHSNIGKPLKWTSWFPLRRADPWKIRHIGLQKIVKYGVLKPMFWIMCWS